MGFKIRPASRKDLSACTKIFLREFNRIGENWTRETARPRLASSLENFPKLFFCLELDGKVIGLLCGKPFWGDEGKSLYLNDFAITSQKQEKGFGLKALRFIEKLAKKQGFNSLFLDTNQKKKAIKIYKKFGFKKTDYVIMNKKL